MSEHIGTVKEVTAKQGKKGTYHAMKVDDWTYNLFTDGMGHWAESKLGELVRVEYEQDGKYRNVTKLDEAPPGAVESKSDSQMSKEDWELKDRRITRTAIAKSMIEAGRYPELVPSEWLEWCWNGDFPYYVTQTEPKTPPKKASMGTVTEGKPQTKEQKIINEIALVVNECGWTPDEGREALVYWATQAGLLNLDKIKEQGLRACDSQQLGAFLEHLKE